MIQYQMTYECDCGRPLIFFVHDLAQYHLPPWKRNGREIKTRRCTCGRKWLIKFQHTYGGPKLYGSFTLKGALA